MKNSKMKKTLLLLLAAVLLVGCSIGGTLAYLKASTEPVVNTFAATGIGLTLTEANSDEDFKLIPGKTYAKDPKVTITGTTGVEYYVFVMVAEKGVQDALDYAINTTDWTQLKDANDNAVSGVYYKEVEADDEETEKEFTENIFVLAGKESFADGYVTVSADLEAGNMEETTLTFTAYAIQKEGFANAAAAWTEASKPAQNG